MGLFSRKPQMLDRRLEAIFMNGCVEKHRDKALSLLARRQHQVLAAIDQLGPGENPILVVGEADSRGNPHGAFLLITDRRGVQIDGSYVKEILHAQVASVAVTTGEFNVNILVTSEAATLDFLPNTQEWFDNVISHNVATPRQAQRIRDVIQGCV